ncbi:hypothetical protein ACXIUT_23875 [Achromobacter denitrificans]
MMSKPSAVLVWPQVFIFSAGNSATHPPLDIFELVKAGIEKALTGDSHTVAIADDVIAQMQELLSSDRADLDRAMATIQTAVWNLVVIDQALSAGASRDESRALITAAQAFEDLPPWCSETRNSTGEVAFARALREHDASRRAGNMLQFLAETGGAIETDRLGGRTIYRVWWPGTDKHQNEWYPSPEAAIEEAQHEQKDGEA